jgi:uncharacterized protein (DUF1697 family)
MHTYLILLRGINVGGKNTVPMAKLKLFLEDLGCTNVVPYIQSGNVIVQSPLLANKLTEVVEENLPKKFTLNSAVIKILVLTKEELAKVVKSKPSGFGDQPAKYYSDVIFLIGITAAEAMSVFHPREGVDTVWAGASAIYSQRLGAERTKSRLKDVMGSPLYKSMTIRNWNTTTKLLAMMEKM